MRPTTRLLTPLISAVIVLVNSSPLPSDHPAINNATNGEGATPLWTGGDYPDPRADPFACNNDEKSALCDPDQVLTDKWRKAVRARLDLQTEKLKDVKILYTDEAKECKADSGVEIFVALAKEIDTIESDQTSDDDLVRFGNSLANKYGLSTRPCRNYVILIGVEKPKLVYFKTGAHLKLPEDVTTRVFDQYSPLFNNKNYMDGLNKIVDDIGNLMIDPFKPTTVKSTTTTTTPATTTSTTAKSTTSATTPTTSTTTTSTASTTTITDATSTAPPSTSTTATTTSEAPTAETTSTFLPPIVIKTIETTLTTTTSLDLSNAVNLLEPEHMERGEDETTRRVAVPWWLWMLVVVLIAICALSIVVCMAARQRKRKTGAVALQLQTVAAAPAGAKGKVHPTIEHILTARDEVDDCDRKRPHHGNNNHHKNNNNNNEIKISALPSPPKPPSSQLTQKKRNDEQDTISLATMSDDGQSQTADVRPTTPTKMASKVHINPERLATDHVARKNKAPGVEAVQRDSVVIEAESTPEPTTPTKVAVKVGENNGQQHNDLRRLQSSGDEFVF